MCLYSTERKLALSGWLQKNGEAEYGSPLKLQKFLFFYEAFSKAQNDKADFSSLKGYKRGPVFSNVWGDYTHERILFNNAASDTYSKLSDCVVIERAEKCHFLVRIMSEKELSRLTHKMNIWSIKKDRIMSDEYQVQLDEKDFNDKDYKLIEMLDEMYPTDLINNSEIINIDNHYFLFSKEDSLKLTEHHFDILSAVSENGKLHNPIYTEIDEKGCLVID